MLAPTDYIGYRSWNRIRNSGDAITPYVLEGLTGLPSRLVGPDLPHILGVGSILFFANKNSSVWGAGVLNPNMPLPEIGDSAFYALRGKKTRDFVKSLGVSLPDVPLGDHGIFAREVCDLIPEDKRQIKFRAAFVPHHGSIEHPLYEAIRDNSEFAFIDILDDSLLPLELTLQSEVVISQSLHGLIYAESLGKPSLWISDRSDEIWRFKFDDWYSTTAEPQLEALPLTTDIEALVAQARLCGSNIDKNALASALPSRASLAQSAHFMNFRSCRKLNPTILFVDTLFSGHRHAKAELTTEILDSLRKKIFPVVYGLFKGWAERGYCLVAPADEAINLDQEKIAAVARFLDENAAVDFAFVARREEVDEQAIEDGYGPCGLSLMRGDGLAGGAIMLRPDSFQLSKNYVTFFV
jgi:hypothetical protein